MKRSLLFALLLAFGLVLSACTSTNGDDDDDNNGDDLGMLTYNLTDTAYAGIMGTVTFEEQADGSIQATIDLGDTSEEDASYPAHIHVGDAGSNGDIAVSLEAVEDGSSVTTFSSFDEAYEGGAAITFDELEAFNGYVNVHLSAEDLGIVVASANIGANANLEVPTPGNIAEVATAETSLSTLVAALTAAGLVNDVSADGEFTVFAPDNDAFVALLADVGVADLDSLITELGAETVASVLQYHVVAGATAAGELEDGATLTTLQGEEITVSVDSDSNVTLNNGVTVTSANNVASNGVVHIIDGVLLYPTFGEDDGATTVEVELSGTNEVPNPVVTDFSGSATVTLDGTTLTVNGTYSEDMVIAGPGAHIHGPAGVDANAGVLYPLVFNNDADTISGEFELSETEVGYFNDGLLYLNLHTADNPSGELRGQIVPSTDDSEED